MTPESSTAETAGLRAWLDVDLGALVRNARALRARAGVPLLPMVKADAYGLGAVAVSRALLAEQPWGFGVATIPEGIELRDAGVRGRIVVFTPLLVSEFRDAQVADLTPTLGDRAAIAEWQRSGKPWQLAIDTGMQRAGVPHERTAELNDLVRAGPPEAAFTHYHSPERDDGSIAEQDRRFADALASLAVRPALTHTDNSAAIVRRQGQPHGLVRPGVFLYGVGSGANVLAPSPVVHLRARILEVRDVAAGTTVSYGGTWRAPSDRRIATVAVGYADGYRRSLSSTGEATIHGKRVPVVGLVTMDMTLLDVTGVVCEPGDIATLIGGDQQVMLTLEEVAQRGGVSPYELLTGLRQRVPRVYRNASAG
ncbi:MAG TPA: alanine racemase [Gemmatimonadaceae bacterium]|nr:alanine racemase [Gemmatimonadaceae bacterium]